MKKGIAVAWLAVFSSIAVFGDAITQYDAGKAYQDAENWYRAIESYQEALRDNPSFNKAYQGLAESFYALGEYDQALDFTAKAESYRKNDPVLLDLRGFILIGLGRLDEASKAFNGVLSAWPNDIEARFGLAEIDVCAGKVSAAADEYLGALQRNPQNRKALLSLAIISRENGNAAAARDYIAKALRYHGDNPQVFYYAAYVAAQDGQMGEAENRVRGALSLNPDYDDARELLGSILYAQGRYSEVLTLCDARIAANRNHASAWYVRALALDKLSRYDEAVKSAQTGLQVNPSDEVLRTLAESIIIERFSFEDSRRATWAAWHLDTARQAAQKNMSEQALYEYRRALKINPYDVDARQAYAKLLLNRGYPARYLGQLKFVQSIGKSTNAINDAVESYGKLLSTSIVERWSIDPLYLEKDHSSIGIYYQTDSANLAHPDAERVTASLIADAFSADPRFSVAAHASAVGSYSEAFRASREAGEQYFGLVRFRENPRDIQLTVDLYVSRTGAKADSFAVFRSGNDRYASAMRRVVQSIAVSFPMRGTILKRQQSNVAIDLGKSDGVKVGDVFEVYPTDSVAVKNDGIGLTRDPADLLGTVTISAVDEDISQGALARNGFYDRVAAGDAILPKIDDKKSAGDKIVATESVAAAKQAPSLLALLRKIR